MTMIVDTAIRTPRDMFLATYCVIQSTEKRAEFLKKLDAVHGITNKMSLASDYARDCFGEFNAPAPIERRVRIREIIAFAESF